MATPPDPESIAAYIDATALLLELPIPPEYRDGVALQFARLTALARDVGEHPLDFTDEPAPLFHPGKIR